ncbi:hypothetical protein XELAEV_18002183mg [Xenopus laevis]|nr:hypothetical protein XELAEV_18002183mg [Xenopus laevis]
MPLMQVLPQTFPSIQDCSSYGQTEIHIGSMGIDNTDNIPPIIIGKDKRQGTLSCMAVASGRKDMGVLCAPCQALQGREGEYLVPFIRNLRERAC